MKPPKLYTIGEIAQKCGVLRHAVVYCLMSRNIEPTCRVGSVKCYDEAVVKKIESELEKIKDRTKQKCTH